MIYNISLDETDVYIILDCMEYVKNTDINSLQYIKDNKENTLNSMIILFERMLEQ